MYREDHQSMDWIIITIAALLLTTLGAFFLDLIPYPVGAALLVVLFVFRLKKMKFLVSSKR
jgi:hypothetical protein